MQQYLELLRQVKLRGVHRPDRTEVGTTGIFGYQMRFDLQQGFPLLTTKKLHTKSIVHELLWFLSGDTNTRYLNEHGVKIWDAWADADGNLGPVYGHQWRHWKNSDGKTIDQIENLISGLKKDPYSRRHIVNAWNVGDLEKMALPPCHAFFQFYVAENRLSCLLYQRSVDIFLGLPFNSASYALLTHMVAEQVGLQPGEFVWNGGDCHIYLNHTDQIDLQLTREPLPLCQLKIKRKPATIFDYVYDDFAFENYQAHPHIKGEIAV